MFGKSKPIPDLTPGRRILGTSFENIPIFEPKPSHSLLLAAAGGGKTTCGAMPWLLSVLADPNRNIVVVDSKEGELAAQAAKLCADHGRPVFIIDDLGVMS